MHKIFNFQRPYELITGAIGANDKGNLIDAYTLGFTVKKPFVIHYVGRFNEGLNESFKAHLEKYLKLKFFNELKCRLK